MDGNQPNMYMPKSARPVTSGGYMLSSARLVQPEQPSIGGFFNNVGKSGEQFVGGLANAVFHPIQTAGNIANLGMGAVESLIPGEQGHEKYAKSAVDFYIDRYGGLENIKRTMYKDPVGFLADASLVLGGAGGITKLVAKLGGSARMGEVANVLAKTSEFTDPLSMAGKGLGMASKPFRNVFKGIGSKVGRGIEGVGEDLAVRALKPTKTQLTSFEERIGMPLKQYQKQNKLYGGAEEALKQIQSSKIKPLQTKYNKLVRSGKNVNIGDYANQLRQQALDILEKDRSPSARKVAEAMWKEADVQEGFGNVTDTSLTNMKTGSFGKVPGGVMTDPIAQNINKQLGIAGTQTLERYAPGSQAIGKELQAAREFEDIVKTQSNLSKGTQLFNTVKPGFAGFMTGAASGSFVPGVGNLAGGLTGAAGAVIANNPKVMSATGRTLMNAGKAIQKAKPIKVSPLVGYGYKAANVGRAVNRTTQPQNQSQILTKTKVSLPYSNDTPKKEKSQISLYNPFKVKKLKAK